MDKQFCRLRGVSFLKGCRRRFKSPGISTQYETTEDLVFNCTDRLKNYLVLFSSCNIERLKYNIKNHSMQYKNECDLQYIQMTKLYRWSPVIQYRFAGLHNSVAVTGGQKHNLQCNHVRDPGYILSPGPYIRGLEF